MQCRIKWREEISVLPDECLLWSVLLWCCVHWWLTLLVVPVEHPHTCSIIPLWYAGSHLASRYSRPSDTILCCPCDCNAHSSSHKATHIWVIPSRFLQNDVSDTRQDLFPFFAYHPTSRNNKRCEVLPLIKTSFQILLLYYAIVEIQL